MDVTDSVAASRQRVVGFEVGAASLAGNGTEAARHDGDVPELLVLEDAELRGGVRLERAVAVEMVRFQI